MPPVDGRDPRPVSRLLWRASRGWASAVGVLALVRGLLPTVLLLLTGALVDAVPGALAGGPGSAAGRTALWILAGLTAAFLASGLADSVSAHGEEALGTRYAWAVHDTVVAAALAPQGIAPLEDPEVAAQIAAVEEADRAGVHRAAVRRLAEYGRQRSQGLAAFVVLAFFAWWAPLVMLAAWRWVNRTVVGWVEKGVALGHDQGGDGLRRARYFRDLAVEVRAAKEVRVFGLQDWVVERYGVAWRDAMERIWAGRKSSWPEVAAGALGLAVAHTVVLGALAGSAWGGDFTPGQLVIFIQATLACSRLGPLGDAQWETGRILHGAARVVALEQRLTAPAVPERGIRPVHVAGPTSLRLEGIRFTYPGRVEPILDGLDLVVPAGRSLAVVGVNGAGKTTLMKLLCGLYEPEAGRILLDGTPAGAATRHRVGVIFQDFTRYELPLRANVGFGCLSLAEDESILAEALTDAGGADLLEGLPAGWDTILARGYEGGVDLSGGQWQKVALARALLAVRGGAGLLILDEPTAHLDVRAETEIFDRFLDLTRDVTTILVSHRLSSVRRADRIVVLDGGYIVEDGTHDELLARGGQYATLYALQAERFRIHRSAARTGPSRRVDTVA